VSEGPDFKLIHAGLRLSALTGQPLDVNGVAVVVPEDAIASLEPAGDGAEDAKPDVERVPMNKFDLARRAMYVMRLASEEITRFGLDIGALTPPPPPARRPAPPLVAGLRSRVVQPPAPEPIIRETDGEVYIAGSHVVRLNGTAIAKEEWIVVALPTSLVSRHDSKEDAVAAAIAAARQVWRPFPGAQPDQQFTWKKPPTVYTHKPKE
jgi:hypothetical protein